MANPARYSSKRRINPTTVSATHSAVMPVGRPGILLPVFYCHHASSGLGFGPTVDDDPLIFESAEQFAQTLFLMFVIDDEPKIIRRLDLSASPNFDQKNYERRRFVYLVAIIALALTDRARKDNQFVAVVS
jgi:hypothetical protein